MNLSREELFALKTIATSRGLIPVSRDWERTNSLTLRRAGGPGKCTPKQYCDLSQRGGGITKNSSVTSAQIRQQESSRNARNNGYEGGREETQGGQQENEKVSKKKAPQFLSNKHRAEYLRMKMKRKEYEDFLVKARAQRSEEKEAKREKRQVKAKEIMNFEKQPRQKKRKENPTIVDYKEEEE